VQDAVVDEGKGLEDVYRAQAGRMWRALVGFSGDPEIAAEAVAEAFARAIRDEDQIRDLEPWLWRVSFRLASAELKRRSRSSDWTIAPTYEMPDPIPELIAALRCLSPNQRLAVVLHDYADRSTLEVAEALGCSRATVHVHLSHGRRKLRSLLEATDA
jgi:RNA polymerase sigma-70 factor (ECF subfamily)